jgi:hypothetical protein
MGPRSVGGEARSAHAGTGGTDGRAPCGIGSRDESARAREAAMWRWAAQMASQMGRRGGFGPAKSFISPFLFYVFFSILLSTFQI